MSYSLSAQIVVKAPSGQRSTGKIWAAHEESKLMAFFIIEDAFAETAFDRDIRLRL
jgi:hypothetical protein